MTTRRIRGHVDLPPDVPAGTWGEVTVELRDETELDAPSALLASVRLPTQPLEALARLPFELRAPECDNRRSLGLRVHIAAGPSTGPGAGKTRDTVFLSTQSHPVASSGNVSDARAAVKQIT